MENAVFDKHERLKEFPPALVVYILYRRLVEHGLRPTCLWIRDKFVRRIRGFSIPALSQVAPGVYVGGQHNTRGLQEMRALGITAVVNMREEADDRARNVALDHYLWLPTTDDAAPALEDLARGAAFIAEQVSAGRGVYIHCASGVGRAPTMAAAYLVHRGATPEEAWAAVRRGRPFIRPTPPQIEAVRALAQLANASGDDAEADPSPASRRAEIQSPEVGAHIASGRASDTPSTPEDTPALDRRTQKAYERIAADPNLTGALTDDAARILLNWAQDEVERLVAATAGMDEERAWDVLDPQLQRLRRHLRQAAEASADADRPKQRLRELLASSEAFSDGTES